MRLLGYLLCLVVPFAGAQDEAAQAEIEPVPTRDLQNNQCQLIGAQTVCPASASLTRPGGTVVTVDAVFTCDSDPFIEFNFLELNCQCVATIGRPDPLPDLICPCGGCALDASFPFAVYCLENETIFENIFPPANCTSLSCNGFCNGGVGFLPSTTLPPVSQPSQPPAPTPAGSNCQITGSQTVCPVTESFTDPSGNEIYLNAEFICDNNPFVEFNFLESNCQCLVSIDRPDPLPDIVCPCNGCGPGSPLLLNVTCLTSDTIFENLNPPANCTYLTCDGLCNGDFNFLPTPSPSVAPSTSPSELPTAAPVMPTPVVAPPVSPAPPTFARSASHEKTLSLAAIAGIFLVLSLVFC